MGESTHSERIKIAIFILKSHVFGLGGFPFMCLGDGKNIFSPG